MPQNPPAISRYSIDITVKGNALHLPILVRKHARSRRIIIRYRPLAHCLTLTLPRYVSIRQGLHFVEQKRAWVERQIESQAKRTSFSAGAVIPVLGTDYKLAHGGGRGVIEIQDGQIVVPGQPEFMARRVREWLKTRAKEEITQIAQGKAAQIGKNIKRISLRDTSSRWGSCSHDGALSFSWRLILAPYEVLEYLVSHEVAHLREHNHSDKFWAVVRELYPGFEKSENWLKRHGSTLYMYG